VGQKAKKVVRVSSGSKIITIALAKLTSDNTEILKKTRKCIYYGLFI